MSFWRCNEAGRSHVVTDAAPVIFARVPRAVKEHAKESKGFHWTWCASYALPALLVLLGTAGLLWRNGLIATPIYASDEYAYLASGKYLSDRAAVLQDDAWLQRIPNVLYFRVVQAAYGSTSDGYQTIKALNVVLYATVGLAFSLVASASALGRWFKCWFLGLYFVLPWSGYTTSLQPEVLAYAFSCLVAFAAVAAVLRHSWLVCALTGVLCAASLYIKPNTVGVAVGTGLFLLGYFASERQTGERLRRSAAAFACFAGALYGGLIVWYWIAGSAWSWWPQLAGSHYSDELNRQSGGAIRTVLACLTYGAGYVLAFLVLFPGSVTGAVRALRGPGDAEPEARHAVLRGLACWFLPVFLASVAMVSYYSVKIGGERLHGRYLGFALPFLLLFTLASLRRPDGNGGRARTEQSGRRLTAAVLAGAALLWWVAGAKYFNIYPWDSPELLSLFSAGGREEAVLWSTRGLVLVAAVVTAGLLVWHSRWGRWALLAFTIFWMVLGNRNNLAWYWYVKAHGGAVAAEAAALARTAELDQARGLVVGSERYGAMSYALFGLAARVAVLVRPANTQILPHDVPPGCRWVLLQGDYDARIEHRGVIRTRNYRLLLLEPVSGIDIEPARDALPQ